MNYYIYKIDLFKVNYKFPTIFIKFLKINNTNFSIHKIWGTFRFKNRAVGIFEHPHLLIRGSAEVRILEVEEEVAVLR